MRPRASWIALAAVALAVVAVRPLRDQFGMQWRARLLPPTGPPTLVWLARGVEEDTSVPRQMLRAMFPQGERGEFSDLSVDFIMRGPQEDPFVARARKQLRDARSSTPEALLAEYLLSRQDARDPGLLRRGAQPGAPVALWAAYVDALCEKVSYYRPNLTLMAKHPAPPSEEFPEPKETGLTPEQTRELLGALAGWEKADPKNGMPVALEAWARYGLHQDAQALARWEKASRYPVFSSRQGEVSAVKHASLVRAGMPDPEAYMTTFAMRGFGSNLREMSRNVQYQAWRAETGGQMAEAVRLWDATADIGRTYTTTADGGIEVLVGIAIEGIGTNAVWKWYSDRTTAVPNGPLQGGRIYYGPEHAKYLAAAGPAKTQARLQSLLEAKARSRFYQASTRSGTGGFRYLRVAYPLFASGTLAWQLVSVLILFALIGLSARARADEATRLRPDYALMAAAAATLPLPYLVIITALKLPDYYLTTPASAIGMLCLPLLVALIVSLGAALFARAAGTRFLPAGRGGLRRILPMVAALLAVGYLAIGLTTASIRAQVTREGGGAYGSDGAQLRASLGAAWEHPQIPPDAWRAEYPPNVPRN